jgi:S-DNA-T family DNA segregation ATPase FtsK/SpoIIIE
MNPNHDNVHHLHGEVHDTVQDRLHETVHEADAGIVHETAERIDADHVHDGDVIDAEVVDAEVVEGEILTDEESAALDERLANRGALVRAPHSASPPSTRSGRR